MTILPCTFSNEMVRHWPKLVCFCFFIGTDIPQNMSSNLKHLIFSRTPMLTGRQPYANFVQYFHTLNEKPFSYAADPTIALGFPPLLIVLS